MYIFIFKQLLYPKPVLKRDRHLIFYLPSGSRGDGLKNRKKNYYQSNGQIKGA